MIHIFHFRGTENSHIYYDNTNRWRIESLRYPEKFLQLSVRNSFNLYPIGRLDWISETNEFLCDLLPGEKINLTLSDCYPNMFTCDDGQCVKLSDRCDTFNDCEDKSDEMECYYLEFISTYNRDVPPKQAYDKTQPLPVFVNFTIIAFPKIETVALRFTTDIYIKLRWYDQRLSYRDLNFVSSLNALSLQAKRNIWYPQVAFMNSLGQFSTSVDRATVGLLIRETDQLPEDITKNKEGNE